MQKIIDTDDGKGSAPLKPFLFFYFVLMPVVLFAHRADEKQKKERAISFSQDVKPLINKYCIACHTAEIDHESGLFFDSYYEMMKGGGNGVAILPGKAKESLLFKKLNSPPPFGRTMPPSKKIKLTGQQIKIFQDWINQGAKDN